ncbi:MAG: alpha/beta hydrolase [Chloroflexi bacterium]|nr:alpha/beta hydrolase [Chloroflexota bacterium]
MNNLRKYGKKPFSVAVVHGGPGAPGSVAPVARELASAWGVLEPLQTADTCEGQAQELRAVLEENGDLPLTLIGHSWGAMLSFIVTARFPSLVKKLVLVGSGVFEEEYAAEIEATRFMHLDEDERVEAIELIDSLEEPDTDKDYARARLFELWAKADSYEPLSLDIEALEVQYDINKSVWEGAKKLRASGELLELGKRIKCPVVAIHGDYDAHPAEGVKEPLFRVVKDFRFILLNNCGHYPWLEEYARDKFFEILKKEILNSKP